jgi:hypothetical protein
MPLFSKEIWKDGLVLENCHVMFKSDGSTGWLIVNDRCIAKLFPKQTRDWVLGEHSDIRSMYYCVWELREYESYGAAAAQVWEDLVTDKLKMKL